VPGGGDGDLFAFERIAIGPVIEALPASLEHDCGRNVERGGELYILRPPLP